MRKLLVLAAVAVLVCLSGRAAGEATAAAVGPVENRDGGGGRWVYVLALLAAALLVRYVWRRLRRRG